MPIVVERCVETGHEHLFGLGGRGMETQDLETADLGNQPDNECEKARPESRSLILLPPFLLIAGLREVVEKFPRVIPGRSRWMSFFLSTHATLVALGMTLWTV